MGNNPLDTRILDKALSFAIKAHEGTERRGKGFPYIVHPMEAVEIAATITSDQEILAAAALHDVVEDTQYTLEDIRREFGGRIAAMVEAESDKFIAGMSEGDSWIMRKKIAIDSLAKAPRDSKIVAIGDKLSNMRAIARDYRQQGDKLWNIFHVTDKRLHEWHYRGLADSLRELEGTFAFEEFTRLIDEVFGTEENVLIPKLIDMNEYVQSGDGFTAISYNHNDGRNMMKLYADFIPLEVPFREKLFNDSIMALGIRCPRANRIVTDGKRTGVEFERISPKTSFATAIFNNPQDLEKYAVDFARECRKLHSTECNTEAFPFAGDKFIKAIKGSSHFDRDQKAKILEFIEKTPKATTCVHGDIHIGNIITNGKENYWIDLGDFAYGNPLFDLGMTYFVTYCDSEEMTRRLFHIGNEQMRKIWEIFVREYFPGEDLEDVNTRLKPYAALMMIFFGERDRYYPDMEPFIRKYLL